MDSATAARKRAVAETSINTARSAADAASKPVGSSVNSDQFMPSTAWAPPVPPGTAHVGHSRHPTRSAPPDFFAWGETGSETVRPRDWAV
jgi:hypothetical protein